MYGKLLPSIGIHKTTFQTLIR